MIWSSFIPSYDSHPLRFEASVRSIIAVQSGSKQVQQNTGSSTLIISVIHIVVYFTSLRIVVPEVKVSPEWSNNRGQSSCIWERDWPPGEVWLIK